MPQLGFSLTRHLKDEFDSDARRKGQAYAAEGRVSIAHVDRNEVIATVKGSKLYHVTLSPEGGVVDFFCTCPRFEAGWPCKHIWATAVTLDGIAAMPETPKPQRPARPKQENPWKGLFANRTPMHRPLGLPEGAKLTYHLDPEEVTRGEFAVRVRASRGSENLNSLIPGLDPTTLPDPDDRALMSFHQVDPTRMIDDFEASPDSFHLAESQLELALPILGRTGRFFLKHEPEPSTWDDGPPWMAVVHLDRESGLRLWGRFERDGERMDLRDPILVLSSGFLFTRSKIARFTREVSFDLICELRDRGQIRVPDAEADEFLSELHGSAARIAVPEDLRFAEVRVPPQPLVTITTRRREFERRPMSRVAATVLFDYVGFHVRAADPRVKVVDQRRVVHRDVAAEEKRLAELRDAGFVYQPRGYADIDMEIDARKLPRAVPQLLAKGWRVEADGIKYAPPGRYRIEVTSGVDWFDLKGGIEFDGKVAPFPALLAAARRGEKHVVLGDGTYGILPEEWLKRSGLLLNAGEAQGDALRFKPGQAFLLDALLAADDRGVADPGFETARRELWTFDGLKPAEPPSTFLGELRPYQKFSLGWFEFLRRFRWGGILADDMGLGKTVQALAMLAGAKGPSLVVVPRSLVFNWKSEASRFAPHVKVIDAPRNPDSIQGADLVLTTYGLLRRDAPWLKDVDFEYVILDEAQAIKNSAGATAKAARLLNGKHRLAMSGTPIENHLGELWSLMEFLNPGLLGAASVFKSAQDAESKTLLAKALRPFILRRTKEQVAPELPAKTEQTIEVDLAPDERKRYDELKDHYRRELLDRADFRKSKFHVLEALLRLRQAACHQALIDRNLASEPGTKLEVVIERLKEIAEEGHKALVFSQFTSLLAILKEHLDREGIKYEYLDGQTRDREMRVRRFQEDKDCPAFLISLKAGGLGLNLTQAEYVFLLDPWWNPAAESQAIDRAHRIGQTKPVLAMRIVARNTVEERVLELQRSKRALADAILSADTGLLRSLTRDDLSLLLS